MPRSSKPRKAYRPRQAGGVDTMALAKTQIAMLDKEQQVQGIRDARIGFADLRAGRGGRDAWSAIVGRLDVALCLAQDYGIVSDRVPELTAGLKALADLFERAEISHSWTMRGPEIAAIQRAIDLYAIQLQYVAQGELMRAAATVRMRHQQVRAGNVPAGYTVLDGRAGAAA